jgi:tetratricopeptide (TPR) repeat protein
MIRISKSMERRFMERWLCSGAALLLVLVIAPSPTQAEEAPSEDARAEARSHAEQARTFFDLGRFEEALEHYNAAYELVPAPGVLFNMGQCHRLLGNHERALFFFQGYLRGVPEAPNRQLVEDLMARSEEALEQERSEEARAEEAREEEQRLEEEEQRLEEERRRLEEERRAAEEERARAEEREEERTPAYRTWWFWTIIGVVVAGATAGGVVAGLYADKPAVLPEGSLGTIDGR